MKDAYYFSHDGNAQDDPKCILLINEMGMKGYGIFWALIEKLRAEKNYILPVAHFNAFAMRWHTDVCDIEKVVNEYNLFKKTKDGNFFYSERLKQSMKRKSDLARHSASIRWQHTEASGRMQTDTVGMRTNAIKGNKRKGNNSNSSILEEGKSKIIDMGDCVKLADGKVYKKIDLIPGTNIPKNDD